MIPWNLAADTGVPIVKNLIVCLNTGHKSTVTLCASMATMELLGNGG